MIDVALLIATLRLAAEIYAELASDMSSSDLDFADLARRRSALADELERECGDADENATDLAATLGDWREGTSVVDLAKTIEAELGRLSKELYLTDATDATKRVLERIDGAGAQLLERVGADDRPTTWREDGGVDDFSVRKGLGSCDGGRGDGSGSADPVDAGDGDDEAGLFPVWFGTNRSPIDAGDASKGFTGERSAGGVHHGRCLVHISKSHRIGSLGSGMLRRVFMGDDRMQVRVTETFAADEFWMGLDGAANDEQRGRHAVVFIHGYNVDFDEAALRSAQLGFDLGVNGPMCFFSWPSKGRLLGYFADGNSIEASSGDITDFLVSLATLPNIDTVHVIAHSMGNRGALASVVAMAGDAQRLSGRRFGQFILAAADVDADVFRRDAPAYGQIGSGTTLYVSPNDAALRIAARISAFARVGRMPPVSVVDGMDTIDVDGIDLAGLGHGYVGEARGVLTDMHDLISTGRRPSERFGLVERHDVSGAAYWAFKR